MINKNNPRNEHPKKPFKIRGRISGLFCLRGDQAIKMPEAPHLGFIWPYLFVRLKKYIL